MGAFYSLEALRLKGKKKGVIKGAENAAATATPKS
jgi:hypothetical protein